MIMSDITFSPTAGTTINDGTAVWTVKKAISTAGELTYSDGIFQRTNDTEYIIISSGTDARSAKIAVNGQDRPDTPVNGIAYRSLILDSGHVVNSNNQDVFLRLALHPKLGMLYQEYDLNANRFLKDCDLGGSAIVAKSIGNAGYIKYASGFIIQWGATNGATGGTSKSIPFHISFTGDVWGISVMAYQRNTNIQNTTKTQMTVNFSASISSVTNIYWIAMGY